MANDDGRVEVGGGSVRVVPVVVAVVVLGLIVLGAAYASRTPYGAEVKLAPEVETAVKEHFAKTQTRVVQQMTVFNCADFSESMLSGKQAYAAAIEGGAWRPGFTPDDSQGNLYIISFKKDGEADWQMRSIRVHGGKYDLTALRESGANPCSNEISAEY